MSDVHFRGVDHSVEKAAACRGVNFFASDWHALLSGARPSWVQRSDGGLVAELAAKLGLGELLHEIARRWGAYEFVEHWQQGEFHHDTVLRVEAAAGQLPGTYLVVATNCNGGIKEVLCLGAMPTRGGLWRTRCPHNDEFDGELPQILAREVTEHWFDPSALLQPNARSEYRAECRVRQPGGGWMPRK